MQSPQYDITPRRLALISTQCMVTIIQQKFGKFWLFSFTFFIFFFCQFIIVLGRQLEVVQFDWIKILKNKISFESVLFGTEFCSDFCSKFSLEFFENTEALCKILTGKFKKHLIIAKFYK
jgi:hypothetical protein